MAKKKDKADKPNAETIGLTRLIEWVDEADQATEDARAMSERCRDYYDSKQLSDAEVKALKKRKQAPVVVNRVKPKMDGLMGMERANKTTAKAYGRTPKHEKAADGATEGIRYVLQDNFYDQIRSAAWDNLLIEGSGGIEVIAEDKGDRVKVKINHIMWDRMIWDPHSRRKDYGDARYRGQVIWLDYDLALDRFPNGKDVLGSMFDSRSSTYDDKPRWLDTKRRRVKIVELYYLEDNDWYYSCFTRGGYLSEPVKSAYINEEGETEDPYEFASLFVDREGNRYGAMLQLLDVQDEINKRRSKALHLMSVRQVRWERGAVEDINQARAELAKPDGVLETTPGMEFEVLKTNDMAQAQFKLLEEAKLEIDAVSYNSAASGKDQRLMSGIALKNREAAAQTELAPMFDVLKNLDIRVYRKVWNRIKQYWREEMWIRVTDNQDQLRWVGLNAPMPKGEIILREAAEKGLGQQEMEQLKQQLAADPSMQEMTKMNEVADLDVDIVIDDAPDSVTMQQEEFMALSEMVKSGIPIPATAIVASSNLKDKDKILKEMKEAPQLPPQVQEQMKKLQDDAQKLTQENQALKADQQTEMQKLQMQGQAKRAELQLKAEMQQEEIRLERERVAAEIQLEREKAQAKIAVDQMVASAKMQADREQLALDRERMAIEQQNTERAQQHDEKMGEKKLKQDGALAKQKAKQKQE